MYGKLLIRCDLAVCTGMHIGGSSSYSAIGPVDSPVVRDPLTGRPILPGSSLKGKLRSLLVRSLCAAEKLPNIDHDPEQVKDLFGSAQPPKPARLQFSDSFVINPEQMKAVGLTEVKSENVIDRKTSVANPRQIERVTAGTMRLLQLDYLGGHGSRGSGRVSLRNFRIEPFGTEMDTAPLEALFREVENYELFAF